MFGMHSMPGSSRTGPNVTAAITPDEVQLEWGETQQFTAIVYGATDQRVTWSASAGAISAGGLLTAPEADVTVVVSARSVADTNAVGVAEAAVTEPEPAEIFSDDFTDPDLEDNGWSVAGTVTVEGGELVIAGTSGRAVRTIQAEVPASGITSVAVDVTITAFPPKISGDSVLLAIAGSHIGAGIGSDVAYVAMDADEDWYLWIASHDNNDYQSVLLSPQLGLSQRIELVYDESDVPAVARAYIDGDLAGQVTEQNPVAWAGGEGPFALVLRADGSATEGDPPEDIPADVAFDNLVVADGLQGV